MGACAGVCGDRFGELAHVRSHGLVDGFWVTCCGGSGQGWGGSSQPHHMRSTCRQSPGTRTDLAVQRLDHLAGQRPAAVQRRDLLALPRIVAIARGRPRDKLDWHLQARASARETSKQLGSRAYGWLQEVSLSRTSRDTIADRAAQRRCSVSVDAALRMASCCLLGAVGSARRAHLLQVVLLVCHGVLANILLPRWNNLRRRRHRRRRRGHQDPESASTWARTSTSAAPPPPGPSGCCSSSVPAPCGSGRPAAVGFPGRASGGTWEGWGGDFVDRSWHSQGTSRPHLAEW